MLVPLNELPIIDEVVRIVGIPSIVGVIVWVVRTYDKGQLALREVVREVSEVKGTTKASAELVAVVKAGVDLIQTNHLAHLEGNMKNLATQGDRQIELLTGVDKSLSILVDRGDRLT